MNNPQVDSIADLTVRQNSTGVNERLQPEENALERSLDTDPSIAVQAPVETQELQALLEEAGKEDSSFAVALPSLSFRPSETIPTYVEVVDRETNEVITTIPSESLRNISNALKAGDDTEGLIVNEIL